MKYVSRKEWGARPPRYINRASMRQKCTGHWNGPKMTIGGKTTWSHDFCASMVRGIQNFHMGPQRNWSDIAYNFVVCPHGYVFEGRGLDRINGANGTNSGNRNSHAIMVLAGEGNPFPEAEKQGFVDAVQYCRSHVGTPEKAQGHRDHKSTECPGNARYQWIHSGMPTQVSKPDEEEIVFFHSHDDRVKFVHTSYKRIAGRDPESKEVVNMWVWFLAISPAAALDLITALSNEHRVTVENKLKVG